MCDGDRLIYLDNNSTTRMDDSVTSLVERCCREAWANPSSSSVLGRQARQWVDSARSKVARCVNTAPNNVIFTSGGTEGNNMVIESCVRVGLEWTGEKPHVVASTVEHDATTEYIKHLHRNDVIEYTLVYAKKDGSVSCEDVISAIKPNTCLVTLMMANNETGVIFPVAQVGRSLVELNKRRSALKLGKVLFHSDVAQTVGKVPVDMQLLNVDFITLVGHKFYGPRIGAVCRRDSAVPLNPFLYGGGQEFGLRSGTENTPMLAGLGEACELVTNNLVKYQQHMKNCCDNLQVELKKEFGEDVVFNFIECERLPNTLSVSFPSVSGRDLLKECPSVIASTGSACHSSSSNVSRVLLLCGVDPKTAEGTLRLSVGRDTTLSEIKSAVTLLRSAYNKLTLS